MKKADSADRMRKAQARKTMESPVFHATPFKHSHQQQIGSRTNV
jgi:hypothetical protein